jgi:N-hydroxyarylamine O-acetyltransferase
MTVFDTASIDLDAYWTRLGYGGPTSPNLDTLSAVALRHPLAIAFENLDPLLGRPVRLDIPTLQQKMLRDGRGGWCFEHNVLLGTVLRALRFEVTGLAARVMWNAPPGTVTARSHMVLHVQLGGHAYIVDAGFGGLTLTSPLRLEPGVEQATPHEPFRLERWGEYFVLEAQIGAEWRPLYRFDLQSQLIADYEVSNWYLCTHPRSHFLSTLIAARVQVDRRYALRNTDLAIHYRDGYTERRGLTTAREVRDALEQSFGIAVPEGPDVDAALARIVTSVPATT